MKRLSLLLLLTAILCAGAFAQGAWGVDQLLNGRRVSDPQVSPDGSMVAFVVADLDWNNNKYVSQIYTARLQTQPLSAVDLKQITRGTSSSSSPRWSPDGKRIAFTTGGQIWTMEPDGDDRKQITKISTGAGGPVWSPNGQWIAFGSDVYPECNGSDECNKRNDDQAEANKVKAVTTTRLLFRHWNEWRDRKRSHVFVVEAKEMSAARAITNGDWDAPPYGAASGTDYAWSPDSTEIAYLRNPDKVEAISTNSDIWTVKVAGGTAKNITAANRGYEFSPVYTGDGKYIVYRSQATPAFEADRTRVMRYDRATGQIIELTRGYDNQADEIMISPDRQWVYFTATEQGQVNILRVPIDGRGEVRHYVQNVAASGLNAALGGTKLVFLGSSMHQPAELYMTELDGASTNDNQPVKQITDINAPINIKKANYMTWNGAPNGRAVQVVQGWEVLPADFDPAKKYPLLVIIHGGPQSSFNNSWGYRWNPQVFANAGYVVFMPNPRGSPGFGQRFVNDVTGDWGGKAFVDIKNGVAEMVKKPYVDKNNIGAAGASYGGYMVDWIMGHNTDPRFKFKALLSHAGVYNLESMGAATEEIWFNAWEFKGYPWTNPAMYAKWSPHKHAANFNTPTLVTAGQLDYRVPYTESVQLYTTLQLKNVDSKFILFPDEGHWIMKPQNSKYWYSQAIEWFDKHLK